MNNTAFAKPLPTVSRHRKVYQPGHTVIVVSTGDRLANVDYVSDSSLERATTALSFFQKFYGNLYGELCVATVSEDGILTPLTF